MTRVVYMNWAVYINGFVTVNQVTQVTVVNQVIATIISNEVVTNRVAIFDINGP
jgi:hypothetical protein